MSNSLNSPGAVERRAFVSQLIAATPDALVISGLGSPSYDVFAAGDRDHNFYLWGAMGGAAGMGVGTLGTIGAKQPRNLTIVVLDNGHFGETGMQRSHTSLGTNLVAVAQGFGIKDAFCIGETSQASEVAERVRARRGVSFVQALILPDEPPRALPPRDGVHVKNRFRAALGLPTF
jgi:thiamine pyrophosphate-dependent acetolactate synthase large subunit-like protein